MKKHTLLILGLILYGYVSNAQDLTTDFNYFPKIEYNAKIVVNNKDDYGNSFEKVVIDGFDSKIPFYVIKPKDLKEIKFVILLHGITQSKDDWINPITNYSKKYIKLKDSLLALGYSVIIPDAKYHGERSYEANFRSPWTFFSSQNTQKVYNLYSTTVKDTRIIMDYIQTNSGNTTTAFDVIGYSMGGMMAIFLNSVDDRLNRVVVCVPALNVEKASKRIGMSEENAKTLKVLSPKNYASQQKAPITLLMGKEDGWYDNEEAQYFFDKINIKDKNLKFYESGHLLPDEFISDVIKNINKE